VLLVPLAVWLRRLWLAGGAARWRRAALLTTWALMAVPQLELAIASVPGGQQGMATPLLALTVLALHFYGLLGFFVAQAWWMKADEERAWRHPEGTHPQPVGPAVAEARQPVAAGTLAAPTQQEET